MAPAALLALALPVLSGCHASVRGVEEPDGTERPTVLSLRVTAGLPGEGVRAVTDSQDPDVAPADGTGEGEITYMQVFMPQVDLLRKTPLAPGVAEYTARFELPLKQRVTTPYAVLVGSQDLGLTEENFTANKTVGSDHFLDVIHKDGFIQTSKSSEGSATIEPGVTNPSPTNGNFFTAEVERIVAKVQVSQKDGLSLTLPDIGTLSSLTYSMAGSAKETYLFRDHAGSRTLDETGANAIYKDFKSVIDDMKVKDDWDSKDPHPFLQRVSDKEGTDYILGGYYSNPRDVTTATTQPTSIDGGIYFYENSMYGGDKKVADKKGEIKYNRIAYAKVYTHLDEIKGWKLTDDGKDIEKGTWNSQSKVRKYYVPVPDDWFNRMKQLHPDWWHNKLEFIYSWDGLGGNSFQIEDAPNTFYYCEDDGEIFDTARAAYIYYKGFPKNLRKYDEGRMVYMLPLNRQLDPAKGFVNYCDTRRNNIYDLTVKGISGIGRNYDPVDPDDPNVPKPEDNPFEPPADPQIPVEPADYLMQITATVLKWNLVEKHYALWN